MPTRGDILLWMSPRAFFATCITATAVCLTGVLVFSVYAPIPSMALGFTILTVVVGGCSAYAGWEWRRESRKTGSLK
jgi:FtsH-binding integral membrane protein